MIIKLPISRELIETCQDMSSPPTPAAPARDFNWLALMPFMLHAVLLQYITSVTRVTTSYRAIELDLPLFWYGLISSGYALLPIFLAVPLGRYIDKGNDAKTIWMGSGLTLASNLAFWLWSDGPLQLVGFTVLSGIGQLFLMAGHQIYSVRCAGPAGRESVFGNYMVALAVGQMGGSLTMSWLADGLRVPPTATLFLLALGAALALFVIGFAMRPEQLSPHEKIRPPSPPVRELLRVPGLVSVIVASVVTVSSVDLLIAYLPLLAIERHIDAGQVGIMLTIRAVAAIFARVFYAPLLGLFGRVSTTLVSMIAGAIGFCILALPLPVLFMYFAIALLGMGLGFSITLCLSNVVDLAPVAARGTAMTMRITGNRMGQFIVPFGASLVASASGVGAILLLIGLALAVSGVAVRMAYARR
ncbi:MFS transporter [Roseiarcaceae bacterium H3SJ34-1]|uniref:MFS transporter n=1 Tax=Terripilifer ovatus TaxID=3032367 RepID=UPI003AB932B1|nr:MFS transporter [Roseiarcaceae bacterium H3SJ34-1]